MFQESVWHCSPELLDAPLEIVFLMAEEVVQMFVIWVLFGVVLAVLVEEVGECNEVNGGRKVVCHVD